MGAILGNPGNLGGRGAWGGGRGQISLGAARGADFRAAIRAYIDHFLIRGLFLSPARLWKVVFRNCRLAKISIFGLTLRCRKSVLNRGTINPGGAGIPDFPRFLTFLRFWVLRPWDGGFPGNPWGRPEIHFWGLKIDFLTTFHRFLTVLRPLEGGSGTHFFEGLGGHFNVYLHPF